MKQKIYYGIQVDICEKHKALWLDGGEYDKLLEIYKAKQRNRGGNVGQNRDDKHTNAELAGGVPLGPDFFDAIVEGGSEIGRCVLEFIGEVLSDVF